jgi:hypothetical protein
MYLIHTYSVFWWLLARTRAARQRSKASCWPFYDYLRDNTSANTIYLWLLAANLTYSIILLRQNQRRQCSTCDSWIVHCQFW